MRIISQDGTIDVPYDYFTLTVASGKYEDVEVAIINGGHSANLPSGVRLAEYSSKEKALKAVGMLREHHEKLSFLKTIIVTEQCRQFISSLSEAAFDRMTQDYFQFPKDDEIEV